MKNLIKLIAPKRLANIPAAIALGNATNWVTKSATIIPVDSKPTSVPYVVAMEIIV
ncbi:hypothetical protein SDC9_202409 [bioreactor metagenome]|uniref:Uncharacterized protein n=1 Tax=bioreactor metagenome TaxID=1076179 RepID=A0A645IV49_9ZZZZ